MNGLLHTGLSFLLSMERVRVREINSEFLLGRVKCKWK